MGLVCSGFMSLGPGSKRLRRGQTGGGYWCNYNHKAEPKNIGGLCFEVARFNVLGSRFRLCRGTMLR